ncbi:MAG: thioredoxin domain-containing protein [Deltaproteobacteria bacterium]
MKIFVLAAITVLLVSCTQAPPPPAAPEAPDEAALAELAKRYFIGGGQIPADVEVTVTAFAPFEDTGLHQGDLTLAKDGQSQRIPFHVTADGRWLFISDPIDLTLDPVAAVLEGITLDGSDPALGPDDAVVTIVEYSDFQCPFCSRAEEIMKNDVLPKYGDQVRFVYKQMPLVSIHPWAQPASEIGICLFRLSGNEAYWKYHEEVFAQQASLPPSGDASDQALLALASDAGGDDTAVADCFASGETRDQVEATLAEAEALGVNSTPTFFVNGRKLSGAQPLEAFSDLIDPELQG